MKRIGWALLLALLLLAKGGHAANVAILRPLGSSPEVLEAVYRLEGELSALGLEVRKVEVARDRGSDVAAVRSGLAHLATQQRLDALIDVIGERRPTAVDVWIHEREPPRLRVSRVVLSEDESNPAETLAIRAIEVLRSNFVEIDLAASGRPRAAPPAVRDAPLEQAPRRVEYVGLEAGAAVEAGAGGVGPALLPLVRLDWAANTWLVAEATFAGLGTRPTLRSAAGSATVNRAYGLVGLCYCSPAERGINPFFGASMGAVRMSVQGRAKPPAEGHIVAHWSLLFEASAGGRLRLSERYYLTLGLHAQLAQPRVTLHLVNEAVATSGRPNLLASLTAGAWL